MSVARKFAAVAVSAVVAAASLAMPAAIAAPAKNGQAACSAALGHVRATGSSTEAAVALAKVCTVEQLAVAVKHDKRSELKRGETAGMAAGAEAGAECALLPSSYPLCESIDAKDGGLGLLAASALAPPPNVAPGAPSTTAAYVPPSPPTSPTTAVPVPTVYDLNTGETVAASPTPPLYPCNAQDVGFYIMAFTGWQCIQNNADGSYVWARTAVWPPN